MNLQTIIELDLKGFFNWWGKELSFLIPKKVRQLINERTASLIVTADGEQGFGICYYRDGMVDKTAYNGTIDLSGRTEYQNLKNRFADFEKAEIVLRLTDRQAVAKTIFLPEAALENLEQVAGFELDRYTPFAASQVYFTTIPIGKTGYGQVQVLLAVTPRSMLDELLAGLDVLGIHPHRVDCQQLNDEFPQLEGQYNLLPERYRVGTDKFRRAIPWLLNGLLFLMLMSVLIYPVWQEKQAVETLKNQIKSLEKDTHIVDSQQKEIDALSEETQKLIDIKNHEPELNAVLNELTHVLKDDTWLTNLQYSEKHLQIQGQSPTASDLIGVLEASPYFSKVSFGSPLTQDKNTGLERFQITMDVSVPAEPHTEFAPDKNAVPSADKLGSRP